VALGFVLAAACTPAPPTVTPAAPPWVAVTPGLEPIVTEWVEAYRTNVGVPAFDLRVLPLAAAQDALLRGELDLVFAAAPPPQGWFATPVGDGQVAIVVHPDNQVRSFTLRDLERLFSGEAVSWSTFGGQETPVQVYVPFPGDELRAAFETRAMRGRAVTPNARLYLTPANGLALVAEDSAGVGLVPQRAVTTDVRAARVEGLLPEDDTYPFRLDILAMAPHEPSAGVRDFLVWLQSNTAE
jgi:DNA-binding transcriptional LysR family regulator